MWTALEKRLCKKGQVVEMDFAEIEKRVVALVRDKVPGAKTADAAGSLVLLGEDGIFDSITALELIVAIEKEFAIVVKDADVSPENLANLSSIVRFVEAELSRQSHR
jgi:acyl carrier protein